MNDTPRTDALREVIVGQYKEDELTGNGMGNILSALTDIETLERERDEAREEIESIKNLLLDPNAVRINMLHGKIAKLDWEKLEHIHGNHPAREQLAAERALADRLAEALKFIVTDNIANANDMRFRANKALTAWKEARSD